MTVPETFPSKLLEDAVQAIGSLPGVGKRSALRLALHLLRQPSENVHHFADSIVKMRDEAKYCRQCWMISDEDICPICADKSRDHKTICVVENVRDVMSIENTGQYRGVYHVLGGIISPIAGIGPSDITVARLVERVRDMLVSGDVKPEEVETTSFYIYRQISEYQVRVSSLARGLGFGDDLEYADELTLGRSIVNRQTFKP